MTEKQTRRNAILDHIDAKLGMMKVLKNEIANLVKTIDGEWVIRMRWDKGRSPMYWGHRNPGDSCYQSGFLFRSDSDTHTSFCGKQGGVKVSKSPRDMMFIAECEAGRDRKYLDQDSYVIEVVDRVDGEIFGEVKNPWRNPLTTR
jgi:hypothetical protein